MKAFFYLPLSALLAAVLAAGPAFAQAVEVVVIEETVAEQVPADTNEAANTASETPADPAPPVGEEPTITVAGREELAGEIPAELPWDTVYTSGEQAALRMYDLANAPWDYGLDFDPSDNAPMEKSWVHKWGIAGVDLVPIFTGDAGYALKKAGIVNVVDQVTDEAGDWVSDETGIDFFSAKSQEKLERKFGWLAPILSFF